MLHQSDSKIQQITTIASSSKTIMYFDFIGVLDLFDIYAIKWVKIKTTFIKTPASITTTNKILNILEFEIFSKTDVENDIPPVKATTIDAKIPKIVMYCFCISSVSIVSSIFKMLPSTLDRVEDTFFNSLFVLDFVILK